MAGSYFYRKIISIVLLAAILIVGIFPQQSLAATPAPGSPAATAPKTPAAAGGTTAAPAAQQQPAQSSTGKNEMIECMPTNYGIPTLNIMGCMALGAYAVLGWVSWVLWLSAILFNYAIPYTLNMAAFIKDVPMVALGWTTFRDVSNLFFIFIVLYIAISTIVGNEGYGIKKLLSKVIIGAILINFSLFFTQAMIDVSNVFALQFYNKITQSSADKPTGSTGATGVAGSFVSNTKYSDLDGGISATFVDALGLHEIWRIGSTQASEAGAKGLDPNKPSTKNLALNSRNLFIAAIGGIILILITSFVFFAAIVMFLARAVTLIFIMILSPLMFLGNVLPTLGKYTNELWGKLFSNMLFAPTYMALLYLVVNIIAGGQFKGVGKTAGGGSGSFIGIFAGDDNMIGAAMSFFILNALMVGCLIIAGKMGVAGGKWAEKTGTGFAKWAGMTFTGASAGLAVTRTAVGGTANALMTNRAFKSIASVTPFGGATMRGLDKVRSAKIGGASYKDKIKEDDERTKKTYDLFAESRQGRWQSDASFGAMKKSNQAAAYRSLGISANSKTGLPSMTVVDGKAKLKQRVRGLSSSRKAVRGGKDISEEKLGDSQMKALYKDEQDAYDNAKKLLIHKQTSGASKDEIKAQRLIVKAAKEDLSVRKYQVGASDSLPKELRHRADTE